MTFEVGQRVTFRSLQWEVEDSSVEGFLTLFGRDHENRGHRMKVALGLEPLERTEVPRLRLVLGAHEAEANAFASGDDFSFSPGIDITHVARTKGLEYDYVILAEVTEAMYPDQIATRHLLHLGATRAAHQLWVTTSRESPSPLLPRELVDEALAAS